MHRTAYPRVNIIQSYNTFSYKKQNRSVHLQIHCFDQSDIILSLGLNPVVLHYYIILYSLIVYNFIGNHFFLSLCRFTSIDTHWISIKFPRNFVSLALITSRSWRMYLRFFVTDSSVWITIVCRQSIPFLKGQLGS